MTDLTDAELNRAVAKACGASSFASDPRPVPGHPGWYFSTVQALAIIRMVDGVVVESREWSPVNNWADCGPLIREFRLAVLPWKSSEGGYCVIAPMPDGGIDLQLSPTIHTNSKDDAALQRAICRAVVEAEKHD